ncbi:hypothetical protein [Azohydromonas aeria]|uniref:hypothetical protein n=1 Tax=Azohydromonas aeria TaxID=2590212 RepID=UPI0012F7C7ED|nr:hypothetical protein [Azohydromonas aeria]
MEITLADLCREGYCAAFALKYADRISGAIHELPLWKQAAPHENVHASFYEPATGWTLTSGELRCTVATPAGLAVESPPPGIQVKAIDGGVEISMEFRVACQREAGLSDALATAWALGDVLVAGAPFRFYRHRLARAAAGLAIA